MEPEEESRMHAEPESETIPYWDSWYSSHFPLPQWSLTPDVDTGVQLKVRYIPCEWRCKSGLYGEQLVVVKDQRLIAYSMP